MVVMLRVEETLSLRVTCLLCSTNSRASLGLNVVSFISGGQRRCERYVVLSCFVSLVNLPRVGSEKIPCTHVERTQNVRTIASE